jgi:predicted RNA binding protein YcfA (HicA-like mRNA interferase family)
MASPVSFRLVKRMLERCGYTLVRVTGSHHIFKKAGGATRSVPVHNGMVKGAYVRDIEKECGKS